MIANKIIECAERGNTSLSELTEAGYAASLQLTASADGPDHDSRSSNLEHSVHDYGYSVFERSMSGYRLASENASRQRSTARHPSIGTERL
jgi:hypothetical protein